MDKLEKFITGNRDAFDDAEPMAGHFSRFEEKLKGEETPSYPFSRTFLLKIAAGILVLLTVSVYIFDFAAHRATRSFAAESLGATVPSEVQDAINYYDDAATSKFVKIRKMACCQQDTTKIIAMAKREMNRLDASAADLKKAYDENPGDERVQAAMIQNHQMKEKVMNEMVKQMKRK
jgi:hypothetical protein